MKGRTVWNKPSIRKPQVYKLLLKLGGEARWKHLKANLKELGWGPTTLKRTLDEMVEEGSVIKEAVAGDRGPEIWYKVKIKDSALWKLFIEAFDEDRLPSLEEINQTIRNKMQELDKEERNIYLGQALRELVQNAQEEYVVGFCLAVNEMVYNPKGFTTYFDALFDCIKHETTKYLLAFLEYRQQAVGIAVDILNEMSAKIHARRQQIK